MYGKKKIIKSLQIAWKAVKLNVRWNVKRGNKDGA
jgi:hypothetical protein